MTHESQGRWVSTLLQDIRYAARQLRQTPLFTTAALLTLAIGIGATTAIFSVVNAVLLRDLPYPAAERIVVVYNSYGQAGLSKAAVSTEELADLQAQSQVFERMAGIRPQVSSLTDDCVGMTCDPLEVSAYGVSPSLFELLGVGPRYGRAFGDADGATGAERVVILSDHLFQSRYGGDPAVLGRTITLAGVSRQVVGIMPPGLRFPDEPIGYVKAPADIWIPVQWDQVKDGRGNQYLVVLASLRPDVTPTQVNGDLKRIADDFRGRFPERYNEPAGSWQLTAPSLMQEMVGDVRPALTALFVAVGCVLLIACANVTNLTLARGAARRRELAVRSALGAGRGRLVQQLLIETLLLTITGAGLGVGLAALGLEGLLQLNPGNIPRIDSAQIDLTVLLFAVGLALMTGLVVGLLPALRQSDANPQAALGDSTRGDDTAPPRRRLRGALVMTEVAVAVVVLIGAALLVRSYIELAGVSVGLDGTGVAVATVSLPRATYDDAPKVFGFHRELRDRLAAMPGVVRASAVYPLPMSTDAGWSGSISIAGRAEVAGEPEPHAEYAVALPGYFDTVGIPLLEGRDFADTDSGTAEAVVVVDEEFARQHWPGESAIGKRISTFGDPGEGPFQTIIGVVAHVRTNGAQERGEPQVYMAALQKREYSLSFVTQTDGDPTALYSSIRQAVRTQDARLPIPALTTLDDVVTASTARERFNTTLFSLFGAVALTIAAIGLYGVLAVMVAQRHREIGIRLALGGRPLSLMRAVMTEGIGLAVAGLVVGLPAAWVLGRLMQDLVFGVQVHDPLTYIVIAGLMIGVAAVASLAPARRATRVNPITVLR